MLSIKFLRIFSVLLLALLMTACSSRKDRVIAKQAALYFSVGTQSLMEKEYTTALQNLLKANELDPENPEIINNLGMAYYFKGERRLAIKHLEYALKLNNENSDARINLASIYFKDGNYDEAERMYKIVLKDLTYDKQARTLYNLGTLEQQIRKNNVAAENYFKRSIKEDDNYCPAYHSLGILQYNRRQFNSALRNFQEASMGTCYETPAPHYFQALALIGLKRFDDARIKLHEVDSRFNKSVYAIKARTKTVELNELQNRNSTESHASRKMLESPDF